MTNQTPPQVQPLQVQPIPTQLGLQVAGDNVVLQFIGDNVVLQFITAQGMNAFFLDRDTARALGAKLTEFATGIVAAPQSLASALADAAQRKNGKL
jgi:hypothetical protein